MVSSVADDPLAADALLVDENNQEGSSGARLLSPELVLVDPDLRVAAIASLVRCSTGIQRADQARPLRGPLVAPVEDAGREPPTRKTRAGRVSRYILRASLAANALFLVQLLANAPWSTSHPGPELSTRARSAVVSAGPLQRGPALRPQTHISSLGAGQVGGPAGRTQGSPRESAPSGYRTVTAAAAERAVLEFVRRSGHLPQFVDASTRLIKSNVAAMCTPRDAAPGETRADTFTCRVWQQPRPPSSGANLVFHLQSIHAFSVRVASVGR